MSKMTPVSTDLSGNRPDGGVRGPRFESHRCLSRQPLLWLGYRLHILTAVPMSTQPSTLRGTVKRVSAFGVSDHRLRGSASPVLTATVYVNGKGQFSTPHRIYTPQPITKKFFTGDYVGDPYGCAKLGAYPSTEGFWAHG